MGKQKRKQADDSTTDLNNQSGSWECPLSARKHLSSGSSMISSRRASLRSAKRLAELEKTPVSKCSRPQISREHCSTMNAFQQPDDSVGTVISAIQVQAVSVVESPSRLLKQVADLPSPFTPEMRHEETEKVGNLIATESYAADIQETEEAHEAGIISNHLNQMERLKTVSPLEKFPLAKEFQVSNTLEERVNKNHSNSCSMFGPPSASLGPNLTELVNMCADEDDEVNSVGQSSHTVEGYQVNPKFFPILSKILSKHGDIAQNCTILTMKYRSKLLEMICEIISELQGSEFSKIKDVKLRETISLVNEIKNVKVDIEWLHLRLVEILDARQLLKQSGTLKREKDSNRKVIETAEKELGEGEEQIKAMEAKLRLICDKETVCKESLARAKEESTRILAKIKGAKSIVRPFLNCSMADYLL